MRHEQVVVLEADLVDKSSPGDDVIITGTLQKRLDH